MLRCQNIFLPGELENRNFRVLFLRLPAFSSIQCYYGLFGGMDLPPRGLRPPSGCRKSAHFPPFPGTAAPGKRKGDRHLLISFFYCSVSDLLLFTRLFFEMWTDVKYYLDFPSFSFFSNLIPLSLRFLRPEGNSVQRKRVLPMQLYRRRNKPAPNVPRSVLKRIIGCDQELADNTFKNCGRKCAIIFSRLHNRVKANSVIFSLGQNSYCRPWEDSHL